MGEEVCSWDGTISAREFYASAHVFEERWKRSNPNLPPWKWVSSTTQNPGGRALHSHNQLNGFLTLEKLTRREMPFLESLNVIKAQEASLFEEDEPIDNATLTSTLDEIEKQLPLSSSKILVESKWTFITQEEHPKLKRPWNKLHCLRTILYQFKSFICFHVSVVGQVVGLRIPLEIMNHHD